jgi:hypothetical protein
MIHPNLGRRLTLALIGLPQVSLQGIYQLIRARHFASPNQDRYRLWFQFLICSTVTIDAPVAQTDQPLPILFFASVHLVQV